MKYNSFAFDIGWRFIVGIVLFGKLDSEFLLGTWMRASRNRASRMRKMGEEINKRRQDT